MSQTQALAAALAISPELFPHALDLRSGSVSLVRLTRADYEQASFLDARIANPARPNRQLPMGELASAVQKTNLHESCHFIFHIGHVGSTLLSRLLGRHPALFSLREPDILRTFALSRDPTLAKTWLPTFLKLWSRTFDPGARALVKATSFVSEIAARIFARDYAPKALVMGVLPESYLATILGGANAPAEARALAPIRLARLNERLGGSWQLRDLADGELIALGWACEASALAVAAKGAGPRVHVMDFDRFLLEPRAGLAAAFAHLDVDAATREIAEILAGPDMRTYSKAPEFAYDAALRRSVLEEGRARYGTEIRRGLQWLDRISRAHPPIQSALELFNQ